MSREKFSAYDFLSPLDARYYGNEPAVFEKLHPYLSETATIAYQLRVEQALLAELEARGIAPEGISRRAAAAVKEITAAEVYDEEERTRHNIRALVVCMRKRLPESDRGYVHLFATSNDIMDTAKAMALKDVTREVLLPALAELIEGLIGEARKHSGTLQVGRTHGRHAVPITVGYWLSNFVERLGNRYENLASQAANLRGKLSGAVGAHNAVALRWPDDPADFEAAVLHRLGISPSDNAVSTQVVNPEFVTDYGHALVSTFSVFADLADDARHLMRSELEEMGENRTSRVGSSTMPHKINPKNFENVKSLWKAMMPRMVTVYMDQLSEHQRDLTNSASQRFFGEVVAMLYYACRRLTSAFAQTEFNIAALTANFVDAGQWIIAEPLYIGLALSGDPDPYESVHELSIRAREHEVTLLQLLREDTRGQELLNRLDEQYRDIVLSPEKYLGDAPRRTDIVCEAWESRLKAGTYIETLRRPDDESLAL